MTKRRTDKYNDQKKDRQIQWPNERKKDKWTNNDLQNTAKKTKDWSTWTPHKTGDEPQKYK
jgi:cytosine/uracil/thiamine/allantoin permease